MMPLLHMLIGLWGLFTCGRLWVGKQEALNVLGNAMHVTPSTDLFCAWDLSALLTKKPKLSRLD